MTLDKNDPASSELADDLWQFIAGYRSPVAIEEVLGDIQQLKKAGAMWPAKTIAEWKALIARLEADDRLHVENRMVSVTVAKTLVQGELF
jgi:hypothetical protein